MVPFARAMWNIQANYGTAPGWENGKDYNVGPPSCKLVYKPHEYYSYKYHKP